MTETAERHEKRRIEIAKARHLMDELPKLIRAMVAFYKSRSPGEFDHLPD